MVEIDFGVQDGDTTGIVTGEIDRQTVAEVVDECPPESASVARPALRAVDHDVTRGGFEDTSLHHKPFIATGLFVA
jgi:hypothetical protein